MHSEFGHLLDGGEEGGGLARVEQRHRGLGEVSGGLCLATSRGPRSGRRPRAGAGRRWWEDPDDVCAPRDFCVESLDRGLVDQIVRQCAWGKSANAVGSALALRSVSTTATWSSRARTAAGCSPVRRE